ncbi:U32 family peptidase [Heliorestis acidaminivorans]|uniref:U32 family peptidase n=1 Tax=Heliorestis acidaminivorans TaxID=553427 RepID=A0A6I0F025_9FIRM|nr:U32 family peptidase [Heliorestis acidaminivorans]KAB2951578.1 U32 family peptidase [Heliorestis acidaminivorans]
MPELPELLAPAGSMEALRGAIENGADAVYLGGTRFGARQYASNFDLDELAQAVQYAHQRNVAVYVTVNTLLHDRELEELTDYARQLYLAQVDALIIQDLGVLRRLRTLFPDWELHGSTQMTVSNVEGAAFLAQEGLNRIVLARELSLTEIQKITELPNIEVEVFVHGALCICYSGQCLMSSLIGGRSGNRGRCAQPCRLTYDLVDEEGQNLIDGKKVGHHLLSPRDIKTIEHLPALIAAGVKSLKIEGRMKKPEYVATVVHQYRQALDRALEGSFQVLEEEERRLHQIFNRSFSPSYLQGNPGQDLMSYKRPNHRGFYIGRVRSSDYKQNLVHIDLDETLSLEDEIEAWVSKGGRTTTAVKEMTVAEEKREKALPGEVVTLSWQGAFRTGDRVFKIYDHELMNWARQSYQRPSLLSRIPLVGQVTAQVGLPLTVTYCDGEGNKGQASTEDVVQIALKRPLTEEVLREQLGRLGTTAFSLESLECQLDSAAMVPLRQLNEVRRQAIAELEKNRAERFTNPALDEEIWRQNLRKIQKPSPLAQNDTVTVEAGKRLSSKPSAKPSGKASSGPLLSVTVEGLAAVQSAIEGGADEIYLSTEGFRHRRPFQVGEEKKALELCSKSGLQAVVALPQLYRVEQEKEVEAIISRWYSAGARTFLIANLGYLPLLRTLSLTGADLQIRADYPLWVMNTEAASFLREQGLDSFTLSPELAWIQIEKMMQVTAPKKGLTAKDFEMIIHGSLNMMISEYCAAGALLGERSNQKACNKPCLRHKELYLQDRMNFRFPIYVDAFCRMHLMNAKDLALIEKLPQLAQLGLGRLRIEGRTESPAWIKKVTTIYSQALKLWRTGKLQDQHLQKAVTELTSCHQAGYTKGHLFRGVE